MRALSIRQPWAWAILHAGKRIENRTWESSYRGPLAIHAPKRYDVDGEAALFYILREIGVDWPGRRALRTEPRGAIVGCCRVAAWVLRWSDTMGHWSALRPWTFGPYCAILDTVRVFDEPLACPGRRGLWTVPPEAEPAVRSQLSAVDCRP